MPVFYLALVVAGGAVAGGHWYVQGDRRASGEIRTQGTALVPPAQAVPASSTIQPDNDGAVPIETILRTSNGLRRKVLVRRLDARVTPRPGAGRALEPPPDYFSIAYLLDEIPARDPRHYLIRGPRDEALGWIAREDVLEWDTRLMAVPRPRAERSRELLVYRDRECLEAAVDGRACGRHAVGTCPLEAEEPVGDDSRGTPVLGLPILEQVVHDPTGATVTLNKVACLVWDLLPLPPPDEPPLALRQPLNQVYLALVVDTTQSMGRPIDAVRAFASALARFVAEQAPRLQLRLALVEYRDEHPRFGFTTRRVCDFTDPATFERSLARLAPAQRGDESTAEAVLAGVREALMPADQGDQRNTRGLSWPTGEAAEAATQMIILLGDAPDHETRIEPFETLARQANDQEITIAAVVLDPPPEARFLSRQERQRYEAQWHALAEGSYRPVLPDGKPIDALSPTLVIGDAADHAPTIARLSQSLEQLLADRLAAALALAARDQQAAEQALREYRLSSGRRLADLVPVLVDTHRSEAMPQPRPDPRAAGVKAPSLRIGWLAGSRDGAPQLDYSLLIKPAELDWLIDELATMQQAVHVESADLQSIRRAVAAGETGFWVRDRGATSFADHLANSTALGLDPGGALFDRTQQDVLQADPLTRAALDDRLARMLALLIERRSDSQSAPGDQPPDWLSIPDQWLEE